MYVQTDLSSSPAASVLHEPDDFRSLKVVLRSSARTSRRFPLELGRIGWLDADGNAFLAIDELKRLAGNRAHDDKWLAGFESMVEYARSKGWVGVDGAALQAHCEWYGGDTDDLR
jgi:hypothetical protein